MYAVIETGGKQYRVELGTEIEIDRLEAAPGETIELGRVLLLADGDDAQVGRPIVDGATVSASVVRQDRGDKIVVFKYRPKARRRVKHGHRQELTTVRISDIVFNGRSAASEAEAQAREADAERRAAEKEAATKAAADKALVEKLEREQKAAEAAEQKAEAKAKPARSRKPKADQQAAEATDAEADAARAEVTQPATAEAEATEAADVTEAEATAAEAPTETDQQSAPRRSRKEKDE